MPYRISKNYTSITHALTDAAYDDAERVHGSEVWWWKATSICGRTIVGVKGFSAYRETIDCMNCQRIMQAREKGKPCRN